MIVRSPKHIPLYYIEQLVSKRSSWIRKKINYIQSRPKVAPKEFVEGEGFLYLGKTYGLKFVDSDEICLGENLCIPRKMLPKASVYLKEWYRTQAAQKIQERTEWHAKKMGVDYKSINIRDAKSRWGSCNSKGALSFNWRLIMVPLEVFDYVVVHELTHLLELNHSDNFWTKVRILEPNYVKYVNWLKDNAYLLHI